MPLGAAVAAYLSVLVGSAFAAYWAMFSEFAPYDDSGFFINSIRLFSQGRALYDEVFSDYGPFSYEFWGALFGLASRTLSTDSGRLAVIVLWLLTSLLFGLSCQRLTGRLSIGLIAQILSFAILTALNAEPMHASGVVCLLFASIVAVVAFVQPSRPRTAMLALGVLVAALLLTKINVGGFAGIATAYAAVIALPALRRVAALRLVAACILVAVGPVVILNDLSQQWAQDYAILAFAGSLSIVLVTYPASDQRNSDSRETAKRAAREARRWVAWLLAGFAGCAAAVIGVILALGTTPGAFLHDTVAVPSHQRTAFTLPISLNGEVVYWAVGAVAGAWSVRQFRAIAGGKSEPAPTPAIARVLAGLAIWLSIVAADPLNISPNAAFALAIVLAWIAAIPSIGDDGSPRVRFVRAFLPSLAVTQALMAYPVAGAQVDFGSVLFVVCGAICFADGWNELSAWGAARGAPNRGSAPRMLMTALATGLAVALAFQYVVRPMEFWGDAYATNPSLPIAGAHDLHLPAPRVATYKQIVTLLRARCRSVITLPGLLSFNLWSELPAPSGLTAEPFWHLLSAGEQRAALARAQATPGLCAVRNDQLAANWDGGKAPPMVPLVAFIEQQFVPIAQYEGYVVGVRRS
jgi:hypothetical protein